MNLVVISLLTTLINRKEEIQLIIINQVTKAKEETTVKWKFRYKRYQKEIFTRTRNKLDYVLKLW